MTKSFIYYLLPSVVIGILSILMVPLSTYYLNSKDFGIFAILNALAMPIVPLSSAGFIWVLSANYYKIDKKEKKTLIFNTVFLDFVLRFLWVFIFWISSSKMLPMIIKDYEPRYDFYFKLTLISVLLMTLWPSVSYLIVLQKKGLIHAIFEISQFLVRIVAVIICFTLLKLTTITLFIGPLISGLFSLFICLWYIRRYIIPKLSKKWFIEIFKVGVPSIPANLFEILTNISDRYFIQRWISLSQLGIYSHSLSYRNIFTMCTKAFSHSFSPCALETFSFGIDSKDLEGKLKIWYGLLGIAGVFITLFSYDIVKILTHGKFIAAAPLVPLWFLFMLSFTYGMPYLQFLFVHKKNAFMVKSGILIGIFFIGVSAFFIYKFNVMGAAIAMVLSNFAIQFARKIYAKRLGCEVVNEKDFFFVLVLILCIYIVNIYIRLNILEKTFSFLFISVLIFYCFGLTNAAKSIIKIIRSYNCREI